MIGYNGKESADAISGISPLTIKGVMPYEYNGSIDTAVSGVYHIDVHRPA